MGYCSASTLQFSTNFLTFIGSFKSLQNEEMTKDSSIKDSVAGQSFIRQKGHYICYSEPGTPKHYWDAKLCRFTIQQ